MQRLVLVCLAAAALAAAPAAHAQGGAGAPAPSSAAQQPAGGLRVAFINSREILQRTPGYAAAESTYLKEVDAFRTEVQRLQAQLDSAVQAFDQQAIALSPAVRQTRQRDLQAMQQRMEQRTNQLQDQARQREQELLSPIQARVNTVIQGMRAELNYAFILDVDAPGSMIVAFDPALNITAKVLQRLQQAQ
ncbi:MAG TPA: OmpH family outer membrane protein [Gemmatimonadales bacterium]|jgi:Skp family chaperone for outer membrane proteins|nr:OmpH family outer membrane protein [Gemmatimonadales bacterium]